MTLDEILVETAAAGSIGGHSVAGGRNSLFGGKGVSSSMLRRMTPAGGSILKLNSKKRKKVAGIPVINFESEA